MNTLKRTNKIFVDAGCIWIGDPCYIMGDDAFKRVRDWNKDFMANWDKDANVNYAEPLGEGIGVCLSSGYGDGTYPVDVEFNDENRVVSVKITFIGNEYGWKEKDLD